MRLPLLANNFDSLFYIDSLPWIDYNWSTIIFFTQLIRLLSILLKKRLHIHFEDIFKNSFPVTNLRKLTMFELQSKIFEKLIFVENW